MIVGLHGKIGSGKQTVAKMMAAEFRNYGYTPYYRIWAGKLKQVSQVLTEIKMETDFDNAFEDGITDYSQEQKNILVKEYDMTLGRMFQVIGTDLFREHFNKKTWILALLNSYHRMVKLNPQIVWLVADTRFPNEADDIIDACGGKVISIYRPYNDVRDNTTRDKSHESETALDNYKKFSHLIANDCSLEELQAKVTDTVSKLMNQS